MDTLTGMALVKGLALSLAALSVVAIVGALGVCAVARALSRKSRARRLAV